MPLHILPNPLPARYAKRHFIYDQSTLILDADIFKQPERNRSRPSPNLLQYYAHKKIAISL